MLSPDPSPGKTIPSPSARFALQGWSALTCTGPDAAAFLQAQTMNDVRALTPGSWHWNGWLTAKGRVVAVFALLRTGEDAYILIVPDFPAAELALALQRFVFRSKLRLDALPDGRVFGQFDATATTTHAQSALQGVDGAWTLDMGAHGHARSLNVAAGGLPGASGPAAGAQPNPDSQAQSARWLVEDLRFGLPRLSEAQRGAWTPQMLSLQRLRAFSLAKGCYPGQEIVARTHYLGQAKRSLRLLTGTGLREGDEVRTADGAIRGSIIGADAAGKTGLAVLAGDSVSESLLVAGAQAREEPLRDGLQRPV